MFWLNRDPIQKVGGLNLYSFAGNSPSIAVDASGLLATTPVVIVLVETVGTGTICATVGGGAGALIWDVEFSQSLLVSTISVGRSGMSSKKAMRKASRVSGFAFVACR